MILLCVIVDLAALLVLLRIIFNWISTPASGPIASVARGVYVSTEPLLSSVRSLLPPVHVGAADIDLSAWIVLLVLTLVSAFVCS